MSEAELAAVERAFTGLSDDQWRLPTKLVPVDPDLPTGRSSSSPGFLDQLGEQRGLIVLLLEDPRDCALPVGLDGLRVRSRISLL